MDLKNLKLEDIKLEDIKAKFLAVADKKTLIRFGIGLSAIVLFLVIFYSIVNPIVESKQTKIDDIQTGLAKQNISSNNKTKKEAQKLEFESQKKTDKKIKISL